MPRTRNPYPPEFRDQLVALARSGRSAESLARKFEPCVATIHGWVKQAERDEGVCDDGQTWAERVRPTNDLVDRRKFKSKAEARMAIFEFIEGSYNPARRHSTLGYQSPINFERSTTERLKPASV